MVPALVAAGIDTDVLGGAAAAAEVQPAVDSKEDEDDAIRFMDRVHSRSTYRQYYICTF